MFTSAFELFYKAGGQRCMDAWQQFLTEQRNYVPSYWLFVLLTKCFAADKHSRRRRHSGPVAAQRAA